MTTCTTSQCGTGMGQITLPNDPDNNVLLSANPVFGGVEVSWTLPAINPFAVAYVRVYRGISTNFAAAVLVGNAAGDRYFDRWAWDQVVEAYYWIELVSINGTVGQLIGPAVATARPVIEDIMEQLTGKIDSSYLGTALVNEIGRIGLNASNLQAEIAERTSANNQLAVTLSQMQDTLDQASTLISQEITDRQDGDSSLVYQVNTIAAANAANLALITQDYYTKVDADSAITSALANYTSTTDLANALQSYTTTADLQVGYYTKTQADSAISSAVTTSQTTLNNNIASAQTTLQTNINTVSGKVNSIGALYTAQVSANGLVGGFGVYNDGTTVDAGFNVNTFWIGSTSANKTKPFIVTGGVVYINDAVIKSITADKIAAGVATVASGYTFILGSGQTLNGYPAAVAGSNSNSGGMGIAGYITNSSSNGWGATTGATVSATGMGGAFYNATSTSFNSFRTFGGFGHGDWGGSMIYHRSWGTFNNGSLNPKTICYGGTAGDGLYAAYWGSTASNRLTELFGGSASAGAVARNYGASGSSIVTEGNLATSSYSFYSTAGASYVTAGHLPFTGLHDGLIEDTHECVPGDIVVDDEVLLHLDIANSVVSFKRSSVANQKGVIGVFVQALDEPPEDWLPTKELQSPTNKQYSIPDDEVRPNPVAYDVPTGMKVAHVNALGEGLINVCGQGGNIEKGDLIVTSSIPGKGMKQADDIIRSYTVAKAREAATFTGPTDIKQIACIYLAG